MKKTRLLKNMVIACISVWALVFLALLATPAMAQVTEPIFTTGEDIGNKFIAIGTTTITGNLFFQAQAVENVTGCETTYRRQQAQWFGSSWTLSGGGGFSGCPSTDVYVASSTVVDIRITSSSDGYYCYFIGDAPDSPLTELNHRLHLCVVQVSGEFDLVNEYSGPPPTVSPIDYETRFINAIATGTASNTIAMDIEYFLNTEEFTASTRPDFIQVLVLSEGGLFQNEQQVSLDRALILPFSDGVSNKIIGLEHNFEDGNYIAYINFYNVNSEQITFNDANAVVEFEIDDGEVVDSEVIELTSGENISSNLQYQDCGITNIFGCITNALIFLFVPVDTIFDIYGEVFESVENKPPFGYYTATVNALTISTTTPGFDFGTLPFQDEIFTPLKTGTGAVVVFGYIFFFTSRLFKLNI